MIKRIMEKKRDAPEKKKKNSPNITGHEWDGITECNNPEPFIVRVAFFVALIGALIYMILYPSSPTPNNKGALGWTSINEMEGGQKEISDMKKKYQLAFDKASFEQIIKDPELMKFALRGGKMVFHERCAPCHNVGGVGRRGYPNLMDEAWIWGGTIDQIYTTIKYGIRSEHDETRSSEMPAFGVDKTLTEPQVRKVASFVLNKRADKAYSDFEGMKIYMEHCASCHGDGGEGNIDVGAPRLSDNTWLYGDDMSTVYNVIFYGKGSIMPYWEGKLDDPTIRMLALYVHQLGA